MLSFSETNTNRRLNVARQTRLRPAFGQVIPVLPTFPPLNPSSISSSQRHLWSLFTDPTRKRAKTDDVSDHSGGEDSELERAIKRQDPKGRISFEYPSRYITSTSLTDISGRFPNHDVVSAQYHLVPFWTLTFLLELTRSVIDRKRNQPVYGYPNRTVWSEAGFSLAAVDKDHFASGLLLPDELREGISSVGLEAYTSYLPNIITTLNVPVEFGNRTSVPPFAFGPPSFNRNEIGGLAELQVTEYTGGGLEGDHQCQRELNGYLLNIICADGQSMLMTSRGTFAIPPEHTKSDPKYFGLEPVNERDNLFGYHEQLLANNIERTPSGRLTWYSYNHDHIERFRHVVLGAIDAERSKGGGCDWTQGGILRAIGGVDGVDAEAALEIGDEYMLQQRHSAPPSWLKAPPPHRPAALPSHLQRAAPEPKKPATKPKPTPKPVAPDSRPRLGSAASSSSSLPPPPPPLPPTPPPDPTPLPNPEDAEIPYAKSALHASIPDHKGCYRSLGIERPDERLILPKYEKLMDKLIRQRFIKVSRESHPDGTTDPAEKVRRTGLQQEVNYAKDNLSTLYLRRKYRSLK